MADEKAATQEGVPTPGENPVEPAQTVQPPVKNQPEETVLSEAQPNDQGTGGNQSEAEGFTTVDPSTLPPELQSVYKQMQADYTRKTQSVASKQKLADEFQSLLDQSGVSYEDYVAYKQDQGQQGLPQPEVTPVSGEPTAEEIQRTQAVWLRTPAGQQWLKRQAEDEVARVKQQGYDWSKLEAPVREYYQKTKSTLPLEDVCEIVQGRERRKLATLEAKKKAEIEAVKDNTNVPFDEAGMTGGGVSVNTGKPKAGSWDEAFALAEKDLGM